MRVKLFGSACLAALMLVASTPSAQAQNSDGSSLADQVVFERCGEMVASFNSDCVPVSLSDSDSCLHVYNGYSRDRRSVSISGCDSDDDDDGDTDITSVRTD